MKVQLRKDVASMSDREIQEVLKTYIEQQTGRRIAGSVTIEIDSRFGQMGDPREGMYTAHCELEDRV